MGEALDSLTTTNDLYRHGGPGFLTMFDPSGSRLIYSTYLESSGFFPRGMLVDPPGNAYVYGDEESDTSVDMKLARFR